MMSDWNVELIDDSVSEFEVIFKGPKESEHFFHNRCSSLILGDFHQRIQETSDELAFM